VRQHGTSAPPPKVTLVDDASNDATVVEVRAHDEPGLLWRIGRALGECGLNVQAARVETLGAEAVDVFYVTDATGGLVTDPDLRKRTVNMVLSALAPALVPPVIAATPESNYLADANPSR
jgi:[protein-PII] uridylyltransferase